MQKWVRQGERFLILLINDLARTGIEDSKCLQFTLTYINELKFVAYICMQRILFV